MDSVSLFLNNKKSKVEHSLSDLNKEISTAVRFLIHLKENAEKIVEKLNKFSSPQDFLKEFVSVNSYLLTYLNVLSEINCKFEMIHMSETEFILENKEKLNKIKASDICDSPDLIVEVTDSLEKPDDNSHLKTQKLNFEEINCSYDENLKQGSTLNDGKESKHFSKKDNCSKKNPKQDYQETIKSRHLIPSVNDQFLTSTPKNVQRHNSATNSNNKPDQQSVVAFNPHLQSTLAKKETGYNCCIKEQLSFQKTSENLTNNKDRINKEIIIKPLDISRTVGKEFDVTVEHVNSPSEFYVHIKNSKLNSLSNLEDRLRLFSPKPRKIKCDKTGEKNCISKEIGRYALYYSKCDEVWCRAEVTDWCINSKQNYVSIFLIDYGESKCVSIDTLQPLPDALKIYPAFAQKCHLYGVYPIDFNMNSDSLVWGRDTSEKLRYLIENSNSIKIKVASKDRFHPPSSLPVTLHLVDKGNESVNDILVKSKYAVQKLKDSKENLDNSNYTKNTESENLEDWNPMKEDFQSYKNNYELNINDPAAIIYGYVGKDYDRVCMEYSKTGNCFKGQSCRKEHTQLDPLGYTTDKEEVYKNSFNSLPVPSCNDILDIQVTYLLKINQFCCIKENVNFDKQEENLITLVRALNVKENIRNFKKLLIPPSIGQIVLAQYTEDDSWYRGKILESQPENDIYSVLFVDYGNKENIPLSRIRAIEPRFLHLPFQAIFCSIYGIKLNPQVSESNALMYLNQKFSENIISIQVISKLPGDDIHLLVNVFDHSGENIGKELIAEGYAVFKDEVFLAKDCETLPG